MNISITSDSKTRIKNFIEKYQVIDVLIIIGFSIFFIDEILQDTTTCSGQIFCFGIPDVFTHSVSYTVLFLRAGIHPDGSHWFSELLIPLLFYFTTFYTSSVRTGLIIVAFFLFWHELIWGLFEYIFTSQIFAIGNATLWIGLLVIYCIITFKMFKSLFYTKTFFLLNIPFLVTLCYWEYAYNMAVTVSGEHLTQWYWSIPVNALEVGVWSLCFGIIITNMILVMHRKKIITVNKLQIGKYQL